MGVKGSGDKRGTEGGSPSRLTLKDIAAELGIAPSTVSNAYNRPDQLSEALRAKILGTAARLGYTGPDPAARSLRRGVSNVIGVAFAGPLSYAFTDPAAAQFIEGIAREVESVGYALMLMGTPEDDTAALPITTANVDGLIVQCLAEDDPVLDAALARRLPTVMVENSSAAGYPHVSIDDEGGARAAAEHVIARGHTQLGIVAMEFGLDAVGGLAGPERQAQVSYVSIRARLDGYRAAVEAAGLTWDGNVTVYECGDNRPIDGEEAAAALLAQQPRPTALLAMSDQLAFGVLSYLKHESIAVPEEVAVIGFDDQPAAAHSTPPLTTVHQPSVDKGRQAGRLLLAQLRGESLPPSVKLPTRLIVRESG